jgi:hypothetical protein
VTSCGTTCPVGYFADQTQNACSECTLPCTTCASSATSCLTCESGYYLSASTCAACDSSCATCDSAATNCTTCATTYFLQPASSNTRCATTCADGFYTDYTISACLRCSLSCGTCSGPGSSQCLTCAANFLQWGSLCFQQIPACDVGQYSYFDVTAQQWSCIACPAGCSVCSFYKTKAQCTACVRGYYFNSTECVPVPAATNASGYVYFDRLRAQFVQATCPKQCSTCVLDNVYDTLSLVCLTCASGFSLQNG